MNKAKLIELMGGDEAMADKFLALFLRETPRQISELEKLVSAGRWNEASAVAHAVKSQAAYLGLTELETIARSIEQQAERSADLQSLTQAVRLLSRTFRQTTSRI